MKFSGTYALLETAGERLALVIPPTPHEVCAELTEALPAERVGFLCNPKNGGSLRVETVSDSASANLLRAAGFYYAQQQGLPGMAFVLTEGSCLSEPRAVVANAEAETASAVLPLPESLELRENGVDAVIDGTCYHVTTENETFPDGVTVHLNGSDIDVPTAEAAAAAAIYLTRDLKDGTMELNIGVGVGVLEIGLRRDGGAVTGLSVGGEMKLLDVRVWELTI